MVNERSGSSGLQIYSKIHSNGSRNRICMKLKAAIFWHVFIVSIFTPSIADTRESWSVLQTVPSLLKKNNNDPFVCNKMSTISRIGSNEHMSREFISSLRGGAAAVNPFPSGYNPFGYGLTDLGKQYLSFNGSTDSDVGRFLSTLKSGRKKDSTIKEQWLEIVRVSKQGQSMRIYRTLDDLIKFCLSAGFID